MSTCPYRIAWFISTSTDTGHECLYYFGHCLASNILRNGTAEVSFRRRGWLSVEKVMFGVEHAYVRHDDSDSESSCTQRRFLEEITVFNGG